MSFTKCCNFEHLGENHNPVRDDGYCMHCGYHPLKDEIETLKQAIIELKKSNDFYGDKSNWGDMKGHSMFNCIFNKAIDNEYIDGDNTSHVFYSGKLAREVNLNQAVQEAYKICGVDCG